MKETSAKSNRPTLFDSTPFICSPGSADGLLPSGSLAGPTTAPCGPEAVPVSRSVRRGCGRVPTTNATSGRKCTGSSKRAGRKSSSGSKSHPQKLSALSLRLLSLSRFKQATTPEQTSSQNDSLKVVLSTSLRDGTPEFVQAWKARITPCGIRYWEHTASGHRTSGNGFSGWPSPDKSSGDGGRVSANPVSRVRKSGQKKQLSINEAAQLANIGMLEMIAQHARGTAAGTHDADEFAEFYGLTEPCDEGEWCNRIGGI